LAERHLSVVPENYSSTTSIPTGSLELVPPRRSRLSWWPGWIFLLFVCLWLVDASIAFLIHHTSLQGKLTSHLAAAFGRPVEVGRYNFSLWTGPILEAQSITVGEDPRFGSEYFVRAESLRVRLRWQSLLRGQLELGTLSLSQPSLNVVRNPMGEWNLAEWLPRPNQRPSTGPSIAPAGFRFQRIEVAGGRVNFKLGNEKLPFALVSVDGSVEPDGFGRWRMDLDATPWRVSTFTQRTGEIHIAGHVGGTSSRLLPALLDFSWAGASISDALRLARGDDFGIRGNLALAVSARSANGQWNVQARAEMRQIHRWNLALRPDNPELNFLAQMKVNPETSDLELTSATLEASHSNAHFSGRLPWAAAATNASPSASTRIEFSNSIIDLGDALAWLRAFHAGVSDQIAIQGVAGMTGVLSGWPLTVESLLISSDGADLLGVGASLRSPVHLGHVDLHYDPDHFSLLPVTLFLGSPKSALTGSFRIDASYKPGLSRPPSVRLAGSTMNLADMVATADLLGWNFSRGWDFSGPFRCDLRWQGTEPWHVQPVGFLELGDVSDQEGASLRAPFLNQAIEPVRARMDLRQGTRHVLLSTAQAFGAHWTGTFDRRDPDRRWKVALSADHLATAELDRWLNPRWRETLIDRMLPFLNSHSPVNATPDLLQADGRLTIDELALAPFVLHDVQGNFELSGRHFEMTNAAAQLYGGDIRGSVVADMRSVPSYRVSVSFSGVDLSAMTAVSPQLDDLFAGSASGEISLLAHGVTRADLLASLQCDGSASLRDGEFRAINLAGSLSDAASRTGVSIFPHASARFTCDERKVQFQDLMLTGSEGETEATGVVDFNHNLDFRLWIPSNAGSGFAGEIAAASATPADSYQLSGTLSAPQFSRISQPSHRPH